MPGSRWEIIFGNHFHLLVEISEANPVSGMKRLLRPFSQGWNRRWLRRGHVFQEGNEVAPVWMVSRRGDLWRPLVGFVGKAISDEKSGERGTQSEAEAERVAGEALARSGLPVDPIELAKPRKADEGNVLVAGLLRQRKAAGNPWFARRLTMGHSGSVSRLVVAAAKHPSRIRDLENLVKMSKCDT